MHGPRHKLFNVEKQDWLFRDATLATHWQLVGLAYGLY